MYIFPFISFLGSKSLVSQNFAHLCFLSWCSTLCDSLIGSLQFLFGSAHVMKLPLFRQACELAFAECKSGGNDYILEHEVYFSFPPFTFSFSPLYICLVVFWLAQSQFLNVFGSVGKFDQTCNPRLEFRWGE